LGKEEITPPVLSEITNRKGFSKIESSMRMDSFKKHFWI
jgi:hypothetical protein